MAIKKFLREFNAVKNHRYIVSSLRREGCFIFAVTWIICCVALVWPEGRLVYLLPYWVLLFTAISYASFKSSWFIFRKANPPKLFSPDYLKHAGMYIVFVGFMYAIDFLFSYIGELIVKTDDMTYAIVYYLSTLVIGFYLKRYLYIFPLGVKNGNYWEQFPVARNIPSKMNASTALAVIIIIFLFNRIHSFTYIVHGEKLFGVFVIIFQAVAIYLLALAMFLAIAIAVKRHNL